MIRITYIILAVFAAIVVSYKYPKEAINPGDLSKGHVELEKDCMKCHSLFRGVSGEKCISCHKPKEIGIFTVKGAKIVKKEEHKKKAVFHNTLQKETCDVCHTDHAGREPRMLIHEFSHDVLEASLRKKCLSCHENPKDSLHEKNAENCSDCHKTEKWIPADFEHEKYFRFDKHHPPRCKDCHLKKNYKEYTCYECHEHTPAKMREEHYEEGIRNFEKCELCHRSGDEHEAKRIWESGKYKDLGGVKKKHKSSEHDDDDDDDHHHEHDDDDD